MQTPPVVPVHPGRIPAVGQVIQYGEIGIDENKVAFVGVEVHGLYQVGNLVEIPGGGANPLHFSGRKFG